VLAAWIIGLTSLLILLGFVYFRINKEKAKT